MNPSVSTENVGQQFSYRLTGEWTVDYAEACLKASEIIIPHPAFHTVVQCGGLTRIDITGAWLLNRKIDALQKDGARISLQGFRPEHLSFIERVGSYRPKLTQEPRPDSRLMRLTLGALRLQYNVITTLVDAFMFIGWCWAVVAHVIRHPSHFRFAAFVKQCEMAAVRATPIVGLISFLIAIVLAYQGAAQLRAFGAEVFTINLVTISVLREMGVLLTAIMLAGRSGSAFAAEIGTMKLNEEVDALITTGLEPMESLVLPRILSLVVMTPLLAFLADACGLFGAGLLMTASNHSSWLLYESQLAQVVRMDDFWLGMIKAPVFGLIISMVGCYHGMKVEGSAESVGKETTSAVVTAIFLVMAADAGFSIVFTMISL